MEVGEESTRYMVMLVPIYCMHMANARVRFSISTHGIGTRAVIITVYQYDIRVNSRVNPAIMSWSHTW